MRISLMSQSKYDELFKNLNYIADEIKETNSNPKDNYFIKAYYKETGYIFDDSERQDNWGIFWSDTAPHYWA